MNQIRGTTQRGGQFADIHLFEEWLDAITLDQVVAAANLYLTDDRYIRVVLLPEEQ